MALLAAGVAAGVIALSTPTRAEPTTQKAAPRTDPKTDSSQLEVPGVFSVGAPAAGYAWKTLRAFDPKGGGHYLAAAEGKDGKVVLSVEPRKVAGDAARSATLKAHFNATVEGLQKSGFKNLKGKTPAFTGHIPDDVDYWLTGAGPAGQARFFFCHTVFGQSHVFLVQAVSGDQADARQLSEVAKTVRELKGDSSH